MKNKKGFVSIYICLFFAALVSILLLCIGGAKQNVLESSAASLSRLWAQSILAEYDLNLQGRYHIFGFYGSAPELERKLEFYSEDSFLNGSGSSYKITGCNLHGYSLRNVDVFKKQVIAAGKLSLSQDLTEPSSKITPVKNHAQNKGAFLFENLPSEDSGAGLKVSSVISKLKKGASINGLIKKESNAYFQTAYILSHFQNFSKGNDLGQTYFTGEMEYILFGKESDSANEKAFRNRILAVREALNLTYLQQDEVKSMEALAIAELLTPGAAAPVTQQTLLGLWAAAESINDYRLLLAGHKIPLMKSEETWAVDLESAMENQEDGYIYTGIDQGNDYEDYLRLFLYLMDERVRLLRIMDLIQMNCRWLYYENFLLEDYYGGLEFTYSINGKTEKVEVCYE